LEIDTDAVLAKMGEFNEADSERASDAGESRQQIGEFLEETGLNNKAFSHCRMVLRMKKDDKRQDWLRSMLALLPMMQEQIAKDGTMDAFDAVPADVKAQAKATGKSVN
jgi:hypothetical protein